MNDSDRQRLRQHMRRARRSISPAERARAEQAINQRLIEMAAFRDADCIALYSAFDGEPDVSPAINAALDSGKRVCLPVLPPQTDSPLAFATLVRDGKSRTNRYGIIEPAARPNDFIAPDRLDLVVTPLVAFDTDGNRLGMGAGYYDRTFAFAVEKGLATPRLVGVAFERQQHPGLDPQPWDVPLWRTVTETRSWHPH